SHPLAQHGFESCDVTDLALVRGQGRHLAFEGGGDVRAVVGFGAAGDPHLGDRPRLQTLLGKDFTVRVRVACIRVHRVHRRFAGGHVVGVAGCDAVPVPFGVGDDHALGADLADHTGDVTAQLQGGKHPTVRMTEEAYVLDPHFRGCLAL